MQRTVNLDNKYNSLFKFDNFNLSDDKNKLN